MVQTSPAIRFAAAEDSAALLQVYAQYIDTAITFENTLPTEAEFARRLQTIQTDYPYLVCEENGQITGYAYASRYQQREAYQWNAELSVYIDRGCTARGVGRRFYQVLMEMLQLQGIRNVYGIVTVPNEKSEKLHEAFDFNRLGTYHNAGYKCGKWHDVALFEKAIAEHSMEPIPFSPIHQVEGEKLTAILQAHA